MLTIVNNNLSLIIVNYDPSLSIVNDDHSLMILNIIRLNPSLPSEDKVDTELPTGCAGGNPQLTEFQIIMQKTEQTELQSPANEKTLHKELQKVKMKKENWSFVQTWENNATPESQDPITRVQAMLKQSKIMDAQQKYKEHLNEQVADGTANMNTYKKLRNDEASLDKRICVS